MGPNIAYIKRPTTPPSRVGEVNLEITAAHGNQVRPHRGLPIIRSQGLNNTAVQCVVDIKRRLYTPLPTMGGFKSCSTS